MNGHIKKIQSQVPPNDVDETSQIHPVHSIVCKFQRKSNIYKDHKISPNYAVFCPPIHWMTDPQAVHV